MRKDSLKQGDIFGRLTVVKYHHSSKRKDGSSGERMMLCKCECGNELVVKTSNLKSGTTRSCGCLRSERTSKANIVRSGDVNDIGDDIAYSCGKCGSVSFNLLMSKSAECTKCGSKIKLSKLYKGK